MNKPVSDMSANEQKAIMVEIMTRNIAAIVSEVIEHRVKLLVDAIYNGTNPSKETHKD